MFFLLIIKAETLLLKKYIVLKIFNRRIEI